MSGLQRFGFTQNDGILYIFGNLNNNTSYNIGCMKRQGRNSVFPVCFVTYTDLFDIFTAHTKKTVISKYMVPVWDWLPFTIHILCSSWRKVTWYSKRNSRKRFIMFWLKLIFFTWFKNYTRMKIEITSYKLHIHNSCLYVIRNPVWYQKLHRMKFRQKAKCWAFNLQNATIKNFKAH